MLGTAIADIPVMADPLQGMPDNYVAAILGHAVPRDSDAFQKTVNFFAGFADTMTAGGARKFREWLQMETVEYDDYYAAGATTAAVVSIAMGGGPAACSWAPAIQRAHQAINGLQAIGQSANLYDNISKGDYAGAALNVLGLYGNVSALKKPICLAAGTLLLTPTGDKPIEQFKPGDLITSAPEDEPDGPVEAKRVEEVFVRVGPILELRVGDQIIETTAEHPFWVEERGWTAAGLLIEGDRLRSHNGVAVVVRSVSATRKVTTVYNLLVSDYHTYFVSSRYGGFSVWAHNGTPLDCAGTYQFPDKKNNGLPYTGQTQNMQQRLNRHASNGRYTPGTETVNPMPNSTKLEREIAEHNQIQSLTGGQTAGHSPNVANQRDPIGPARRGDLGLPEPRP
jgi:hypothetical protein